MDSSENFDVIGFAIIVIIDPIYYLSYINLSARPMKAEDKKVYFSTLTINRWVPVFLEIPETNFIILNSFSHFVTKMDIEVNAFVIMKDHIHLLWSLPSHLPINSTTTSFTKHTGTKISALINSTNPEYLENFSSARKDRAHKIWKQSKSDLLIKHDDIFQQKLKYIHDNPTKGDYKTVDSPEEYMFSSAKAYLYNMSNFSFLTMRK